jgi:hypothetical protein
MSCRKWFAGVVFLFVAASQARAAMFDVVTDTSWRAIGPVGNLEGQSINNVGLSWEAQHQGWNTSLSFDDSDAAGWHSPIQNLAWYQYPNGIWGDNNSANNGSTPAYYRKVFTIDGVPTEGLLSVGVDDDVQIWINGHLVVDDHNYATTVINNLAVGSCLQAGENLIVIKAQDSVGYCEWLGAALHVQYNSNPIADAGPDQTVAASDGLTEVHLDGSASFDPDGDELTYAWFVAEGSGAVIDDPASVTPTGHFPMGPTLVTLTVDDGHGGIHVDDVLITVVTDNTPPVVVCTTDTIALWPPDHRMVDVTICLQVSDDCASPEDLFVDCRVSSSEPDDASGDGSFTGDVSGHDGFTQPLQVDLAYDELLGCYTGTVSLRAERDGSQAGRTYSITCDVIDLSGNAAPASCVVVVPHDRRKL